MKVTFNKIVAAFSQLTILAEKFSWKCISDVSIYNRVLLSVTTGLGLRHRKIIRSAHTTFQHDIINNLATLPRKVRKLVLLSLARVLSCIIKFPEYFEDITACSSVSSKSLYNIFHTQFVSDSSTIHKKYGTFSDIELVKILIRKHKVVTV
jgi:hypothetical protein